jgi:hypothetical protein
MTAETGRRWTPDQVRARLLAMGDTLRAWRPHGPLQPLGYRSAMPAPLLSAGELFAAQVEQLALASEELRTLGLEPSQARLLEAAHGEQATAPEQPSARAIDEMTEALRWFAHIVHPYAHKTPLMRKVVWEWALRRNRRGEPVPPAAIARRFDLTRDTVRVWLERAYVLIAAALSRSGA